MTLLAYEATGPSRQLLAKYGMPDAKNVSDLEAKLAQLYFDQKTDKATLEKEFAQIHPHYKWFVRQIEASKPIEVQKELIEVSNADGPCTSCKCPSCQSKSFSNFDYYRGSEQERNASQNLQYTKENPYMAAVPVVALVGIFSVLIYALAKNK